MGGYNIFWTNLLEYGANLATIAGLLFVGYEIKMSKEERELQHDKQEKLKAIELAELYANNVMKNIEFLTYIFNRIDIENDIKNIKYADLREFDIIELEGMFGEEEANKIIKKITKVNPNIIKTALLHQNPIEYSEMNIIKMNNESISEVAATIDDSRYEKAYQLRIMETLNTLEYFSMYFNNYVANEEIVYQSLHQSFLSTIKVLYFLISSTNKKGKDKYYTNIIKLYNKWADRYLEREITEINANRNNIHKPQKIKR